MLTQMVNNVIGPLGYQVTRHGAQGYVLHNYAKRDGTFDYERYRRVQEEANKKKINSVWVIEENIAHLSSYVKSLVPDPRFGICHGTRRGKEQEWFRKYLGCEVIGTEISETATSFPNTIQWDFHEVKPEWINSVDFIYSNSFDHSYAPDKCLNAWMSCVKKGGICILEHSTNHEPGGASEMDPFGATLYYMPYLITTWGQGKFGVREIFEATTKRHSLDHMHYIVIQKF